MALTFTVNPGYGSWSAEGFGPYVDQVTIDDPSPELVRFAAHAHSAGVLDVTEGLDESQIQTQEEGEAAYAAAQGTWIEGGWNPDGTASPGRWSGGWQDGSLAQYELDEARKRLASATTPEDVAAAEANLASVDASIQARFAGEAA